MYSSYNSRISNYITPPSTGYHTRCHHGSHHGNRSADTARYRSTGLDYNGYRSTRSPTTSWNRSPSSYDSFSYSSGRSSLTSPSYTPSYSSRTHAEYSPKYSTPSRSRSSSSCTDAEIPTTPFSPISTSTRFSSFAQRPPSPRVSTPKTLNFSRDDLDISPLSPTITKHDDESNSPDGSNSTEKQFEKPDRSKWSEFLEPNDDNTGVVKHVAEGGRWVGDGFHPVDLVELTADRGYLLWTNPRGSIEVKFKYGKTGDDFRCFIDPQYQGVKIYELKGYKKEMIIDGREAVTKSRNSHHMPKSPARHRENNFEFRSRDGEVTLLLEACREYNVPKSQAFKFNYVLAL